MQVNLTNHHSYFNSIAFRPVSYDIKTGAEMVEQHGRYFVRLGNVVRGFDFDNECECFKKKALLHA